MNLRRLGMLFVVAVAAFSGIFVPPCALGAADGGFFCALVRQRYPQLKWTELKKGDRLTTGDAILTCEGSEVILTSDCSMNPTLTWERSGTHLVAKVPAERLVVLQSTPPPQPASGSRADVVGVTSHAFYSTNRDLIARLKLSEFKLAESEAERRKQMMYAELGSMRWRALTAGEELTPWDVIWTQPESRVEVEVTRSGTTQFIHDGTDVKDSLGRPTGKKRFPENSFLVIHPQFYRTVRVNRIIGDVRVAKNQGRDFANTYDTLQGFLGFKDREAQLKWEKMLKKKELE
jgi:hypothetical protein